MPFHVVKRKDGKFDVENADTKEVKNKEPYADKGEADKYSSALNAHSGDKVEPANFEKFFNLTKVDARTHQAWGIWTDETPDTQKEIMDYVASKSNFEKWSADQMQKSGGKSKGNVRAMHGSNKVSAGIAIDMQCDDVKKQIYGGVEIIDPIDIEKVEKGAYTGFSIGGSYGKRWKDGEYTRYEAIPVELTLADRPSNPSALFEYIKTDGTTEMRKFEVDESGFDKVEYEVALKKFMEKYPQNNEFAKWVEDHLEKDEQYAKDGKTELSAAAVNEPKDPGKDGTSSDGAAANKDVIRTIVLGILEELGLVVKEDGVNKAVQPDFQKTTTALELQKTELTGMINELSKTLTGDLAKIVVASEDLAKRVNAVTGMGPVIMIPGDPQQAQDGEIEILKKYMDAAATPDERQTIGKMIAQLEIRQVHKEKDHAK